jgi:hypothetical protein
MNTNRVKPGPISDHAFRRPLATAVALLLGVVLCTSAVRSFTQDAQQLTSSPSNASEAEDWLLRGDPRSVAWGAHYAVATKDQAIVPTLLSLADRWQGVAGLSSDNDPPLRLATDQLDQRDAMAAVLDALIQTHALVPVSTLRNLAADFPNYVAILLARLPLEESQALSLELYHAEPKASGERNLQYVSAALLAQTPPPGFAANLFSGIHNRATIFVTKPGSAAGPPALRGGSAGCFGPQEPRKEWPNFGVYVLSAGKVEESFVIIPGTHPVYAGRSETTHYCGGQCQDYQFLVLGPEERRSLLAQMLNVEADDICWDTESKATLEFRSEPQFYRDLEQFVAAQQRKYRVTAAALAAKNLLSVAELEESLPQLDLHFEDQRGTDYAPIAAPPRLPPHVTWPDNP